MVRRRHMGGAPYPCVIRTECALDYFLITMNSAYLNNAGFIPIRTYGALSGNKSKKWKNYHDQSLYP